MRAADVTRRAMTRTLQEFNLTLPQFNVLIILRREQELPTLDVAARLVEETPGITRLMNTLVAKRHIRRRRSKADARQQLCSLTERGRHVIDSLVPNIKATQQGLIADLDRGEALQMIALLRRLRDPQARSIADYRWKISQQSAGPDTAEPTDKRQTNRACLRWCRVISSGEISRAKPESSGLRLPPVASFTWLRIRRSHFVALPPRSVAQGSPVRWGKLGGTLYAQSRTNRDALRPPSNPRKSADPTAWYDPHHSVPNPPQRLLTGGLLVRI